MKGGDILIFGQKNIANFVSWKLYLKLDPACSRESLRPIDDSVGFSGTPNNGTPWTPYYSHTTPIRILKDIGIVWESYHKGVPYVPQSSTPYIGDGRPPTFNRS